MVGRVLRPPGHPTSERVVRVLLEDSDLIDRLDGAQRRAAARLATAGFAVRQGSWRPVPCSPRAVGLLVLSGWVVRRRQVPWGPVAELFGPGDLLRSWQSGDTLGTPASESWQVLGAAEFALLDARFVTQLGGFPAVTAALFERQAAHLESVATQLTAAASKRLDSALLLLLRYLADRWGRVTRDGVHVPVPLSHRLLAEMVGARRPSVSVALKLLDSSGELTRLPDRTWLLPAQHLEIAAA